MLIVQYITYPIINVVLTLHVLYWLAYTYDDTKAYSYFLSFPLYSDCVLYNFYVYLFSCLSVY